VQEIKKPIIFWFESFSADKPAFLVFKSLSDKVEDGEVSIDSLVDGSYGGAQPEPSAEGK
jgi:hypothetical protein